MYYQKLKKSTEHHSSILEIGGGAHPSLINRNNINYTIVDPDTNELTKAPQDTIRLNTTVEKISNDKKYDLILSKMVLEHIEHPDDFHKKIFNILHPGGTAIHFFACRHSLPAIVNRLLPESIGDGILKLLKNRDLKHMPKYKAYYRRTKGHTKSQLAYFKNIGFSVEEYHSFVGHKYFINVPILRSIEKLYGNILKVLGLYQFATVALVSLSKPIEN